MPRYRKIYESEAEMYDALVSREDYQGNLLPALDKLAPLEQKHTVEFGAGTGRLTRLIATKAAKVLAFDGFQKMVDEGRRKLTELQIRNASIDFAENKELPIDSSSADITLAGWTFGHATSWYPKTWELEIAAAVQEMKRITRTGGSAIILETLGTGFESPFTPPDRLAHYYTLLEEDFGFTRSWIRTDYRFENREIAESLTQGFFGKSFDLKMDTMGACILPECTGLWHFKKEI
jgi:ubiquinone/menaquinone biosynthesis C-methylase UbiE